MAKTVEEKRTYSREYLREKRKDPEWLKAYYDKRKADVELKEYQRKYQEKLRRARGVKTPEQLFHEAAENFLIKSKEIHHNLYDYSLVAYQAGNLKVQIVCPNHGAFAQSPQAHLRGQGCPQCATEKRTVRNKSIAIEASINFTIKAEMVHGELYSYSKSVYKNVHTKLEIECAEHGAFWQTPAGHLQGQGCPHCANDRRAAFAESKGEQAIAKWLDDKGLLYEKQKMFEGCFDRMPLRYDFYVPSLNLAIEFDGAQHFEFVKKFHGTEDGFERCKRRDDIKNEYVKLHNINMLRIKYSEEKLIDKILTESILVENKSEN